MEPLAPGQPPRAFRWRGRRYVVHSVLTHWVETGRWWAAPLPQVVAAGASTPLPQAERQLWRVEAGARGGTGVLDLCRSTAAGEPGTDSWTVRHVHD
jgi:hypothetical protein